MMTAEFMSKRPVLRFTAALFFLQYCSFCFFFFKVRFHQLSYQVSLRLIQSFFFLYLNFIFRLIMAWIYLYVGYIVHCKLLKHCCKCWWFGPNPGSVKPDTVSPTARHRCSVSSELCRLGAKSRLWASPFVTRFGIVTPE